ncbi:DUF2271 domain-containing protein [Aquihabitans sp. McL0605]|uniref:DUF2271 domain-containing protein n=1 Tax=Aquihabitans sp. McL0605 TaxID=3415671 RepID=UPI003CEA923E
MTPPGLPEFEAAQRRQFLKRAAQLGALALVPGALAACSSNGDKATFAGASTTAASGSTASTTAPSAGSGGTSTTGSATSSGDALPDAAKLEVAFTWSTGSGGFGQDHNPFIAVWIESAAGDLIANISLWYNPPKGERWINELSTWFAADSAYYQAHGSDDRAPVTGATRAAGSYTVVWDGLDAAGKRAAQGDYVVFVEANQEHGTHSLTSAKLSLATSATDAPLADDGNLSAATATYSV